MFNAQSKGRERIKFRPVQSLDVASTVRIIGSLSSVDYLLCGALYLPHFSVCGSVFLSEMYILVFLIHLHKLFYLFNSSIEGSVYNDRTA